MELLIKRKNSPLKRYRMGILKFMLALSLFGSLFGVILGETGKEFFISPIGLKFIAGVLSLNLSSELLDGNLQALKVYKLEAEDLEVFVLNLKITDIQTPEPGLVTVGESGLNLTMHDMSLEMQFQWKVKKGKKSQQVGMFSSVVKELNFDLFGEFVRNDDKTIFILKSFDAKIQEFIPKFKEKIPKPLNSVTDKLNKDFQDSITLEVIMIVVQSLNTILS